MAEKDYREVGQNEEDSETIDFNEKLLAQNPSQESSTQKRILSSITTAVSNLSVQYNFGSIAAALIIMSTAECTLSQEDCKNGDQALWVSGTATATVFAGAITGQLSMGYAGDVLGRDRAMRLTLSIAAISALLSSIAPNGPSTVVYAIIIICRFLMGIGLGGVYPLSAVKAAEDSGSKDDKVDSSASSRAFFWQTPGSMLPWLVAYILTFQKGLSVSLKWRLLLGLGFIPSAMVVGCSAVESYIEPKKVQDTAVIHQDSEKPNIFLLLKTKSIRMKLLATGGGWFLYDICYYGVNLFGGEILDAISTSEDDSVSSNKSIRDTSTKQLLALSAGLPAVILAIALLKPLGTKLLQTIGFVVIAICFVLMAALFYPLKKQSPDGLFVVYCFLLFSLSFGPNVTTFVLPAETYPKNIRSTFNGISAAMGKLGAVFGAYMFGPIADISSYPVVMMICAGLAVAGAILSHYCIEANDEIDLTIAESDNDADILMKKTVEKI